MIEPAGKGRVDRVDRRRTFLPGAQGRDFGLRMIQQDLDQFQGGIARGPDNRDLHHLAQDLLKVE